jgi:hypothetical protein
MPRVSSSSLYSIDHDERTNLLTVIFLDRKTLGPGTEYRYFDVPRSVYDSVLKAESHGRAFAELIKGKYSTIRA